MKNGTCKHYTGTFHNTHCGAGVCYRDVTTDPDEQEGSALRIPCHSQPFPQSTPSQLEHFNRRGSCGKYEEPTAEELAEFDRDMEDAIAQTMLAIPLIEKVKAEHEGKNWKGVEACPVCGGKLHMTHAACNGHVWGKCETEGCLAWME